MPPELNPETLKRWQAGLKQRFPDFPQTEAAGGCTQILEWAANAGVDEDELLKTFSHAVRLPWEEDPSGFVADPEFIGRYPISLARQHRIIGGQPDDGTMSVLIGSLSALDQLDHIRRCFGVVLRPRFGSPGQILETVNLAYQRRSSETHSAIEELDRDEVVSAMQIRSGGEDLLETTGKSPVIKLTNSLIFDAIRARSSDIHIQPYADFLQVRFRIDGVLFDQFQIPRENQEEILSRVKVMGEMNIAEKRLPQDGRASVSVGDRDIDLRIASLPTSHGERVVIRLLDKGARLYTLEELGMSPAILTRIRRLIHQEHGLFLVTGPTGGGKSTTLYAALQEINVKDKNVVTLEDPIEYQLDGISQTQVNEKKGLTFARGLRNVLRQDPDIIMVGEIRDRETAEMAIQSALTGHMVYSTLHTNDATSAVTRLLDLGIEPYLVASSLVGVLAQRLVRRICPDCRTSRVVREEEIVDLGATPTLSANQSVFQGAGCDECRQTGYSGRVGIFEMMLVSESIRSLVQRRCNASEIRQVATAAGMQLLREDGLAKIAGGETTVEEVLRVSMETHD